MRSLTGSQIRYLRSLAHKLKPIVSVGQAGTSDAVILELNAALEHHELLKVKIHTADRAAMQLAADDLATRSNAAVVQTIGRVLVLYRPANTPRIVLPR